MAGSPEGEGQRGDSGVRTTLVVAVRQGVAVGVEDAKVPVPSVQVDAAVALVGLGIESNGVPLPKGRTRTRLDSAGRGGYSVITMRAKLVRIGNSRGVRLPRPLIAEAGLPDEVDLRVEDNTIVIAPARLARDGWAEAAQKMGAAGEDEPLASDVGTSFQDDEWRW